MDTDTYYRRATSDSCLIEHSSWLEELLDMPWSPPFRAPRRTLSYSTFLEVEADSAKKQISPTVCYRLSAFRSENAWKAGGSVADMVTVKHNQQDHDASSGKQDASNANPSTSNADVGRAKQQLLYRLRKLQYMAELDREIKDIQSGGSEIFGVVEYFDRQLLILGMENQALRQRLDGLTHEQQIKFVNKNILGRELSRLQLLYNHERQQRKQQQCQKPKANLSI